MCVLVCGARNKEYNSERIVIHSKYRNESFMGLKEQTKFVLPTEVVPHIIVWVQSMLETLLIVKQCERSPAGMHAVKVGSCGGLVWQVSQLEG